MKWIKRMVLITREIDVSISNERDENPATVKRSYYNFTLASKDYEQEKIYMRCYPNKNKLYAVCEQYITPCID